MKENGVNYDIDFRMTVEKSVLGPIINYSDMDYVQQLVRKHNLLPSDFRAPIHKQIFKAILECYEKNIRPDIVNLGHLRPIEYRENNAKFWEYPLIDITTTAVTYVEIESKIMILKQFVIMDFWNNHCNKVLYGNWNDKDVIGVSDNIIEGYSKLFDRLTAGIRKEERTILTYEDEIKMKVKRYTAGKSVGIPTGVPAIDEFTTGYCLGELFIIAARPGMGKTTFALISAWNAACNGIKTVFFSLEMPKNQLISKLASLLTKIPYKRIKQGALTNEELKMVLQAHKSIENSNLLIDDKARTIEDISEKSSEYAVTHEARLFFMDYIQRCKSRTKMEIRFLIIEITRELKSIAKDNYVAFVALSQLSRAVERRDNKRPMLSDLKESSSIEEDADLVAFLYCQAYYDAQQGHEPGYSELFHTEFIIGKGRDTGTSIIHLFLEPIKMFVCQYRPMGDYDDYE